VSLGPDNGGIILDISECGLSIQAVAPLGPDSVLELSFGLPQSREKFQANGQVTWISQSKKQAGILLIDLPEEARTLMKEWISKQPPGSSSPPAQGLARDKDKILEMPPAHPFKVRSNDVAAACRMTNEQFDTIFPSEKVFTPAREKTAPTPIIEKASTNPIETKVSMRDWVSGVEEKAEAARERMEGLASAAQAPQPIQNSPAQIKATPYNNLLARLAAEEPQPLPPLPISIAAPAVEAPDAGTSSLDADIAAPAVTPPAEIFAEHAPPTIEPEARAQAAIALWAAPEAAPQISEAGVASEPLEIVPEPLEAPADEALPARFEVAPTVELEAPHPELAPGILPMPIVAADSTSPPPAEPPPLGERVKDSSEEIVADLRATFGRAAKPRPKREFAQERWAAVSRAENTAPTKPEAAALREEAQPAPMNAGGTAVPVSAALTVLSSAPSAAPPAERAAPAVQAERPAAAIFASAGASRAESKAVRRPDFGENFRRVTGINPGQAGMLLLACAIVIATGLAFERKVFYGSPERATAAAGDAQDQATLQAAAAALQSVGLGSANSSAARNATNDPSPTNAAPNASAKTRRERSTAPARGHEQSAPAVAGLTPPVVADRAAPDAATEKVDAPTIPAQLDKGSANLTPAAATSGPAAPPKPSPTPTVTTQVSVASAPPGASPQATAPGQAASPIVAPGDRVVPASVLYRVEAMYPPEAVQKHVEGTVKLNAVVGRDGRVMGLGVVSGPPLLVPAALSAAREWRYVPALLNGEPVETQMDMTIDFHLASDGGR
jgi:TonB family protein